MVNYYMSRDLPPELRYSAQYAWDLIQLDWMAGVLPVSNICLKYGVTESRLRAVATKFGWTRRTVQPTVEDVFGPRSFGALPAPPGSQPVSLEEVRITARDQARLVLGSHRKDIEDLKSKLNDLMARYEALTCGADPNAPGVEGARVSLLPVLGGKESPMDFLLKASQVLVRVVGLERQAYGLDVLVDPNEDPATKAAVADTKASIEGLWSRVEAVAAQKASEAQVSSSPDPAPTEATKH